MRTHFVICFLAAMCWAMAGLNPAVQAGPLNGHPDAYDGIAGSALFDDGSGLSGRIDYAIFTPANFNANFGGLGYVPGEGLVYAFQLENMGSQRILSEMISISNPASLIGTFDIGDIDASAATLVGNAEWTFGAGIATGESSWGLAFTSIRTPIVGFTTIEGADTSLFTAGVPVPGSISIPEPGSATIVLVGAVLLGLSRRVRRRC